MCVGGIAWNGDWRLETAKAKLLAVDPIPSHRFASHRTRSRNSGARTRDENCVCGAMCLAYDDCLPQHHCQILNPGLEARKTRKSAPSTEHGRRLR